jgi:hypothetical protein
MEEDDRKHVGAETIRSVPKSCFWLSFNLLEEGRCSAQQNESLSFNHQTAGEKILVSSQMQYLTT